MTTYRLGINTCFAVKRWPQPERWAQLVRDELGLDLVQHSLDLVELDNPPHILTGQADRLRAACASAGLTLHSTFTGLAAYSSNLLLHPDPAARERARAWYREVIGFTAAAGAGSTGGHVGAYSIDDWRNPVRRRELWTELGESLAELAGYARHQGLSGLMAENLAAAREPSTLQMLSSLLTDGDEAHVPITLCLDVGHQCVPGTSGRDRDPYAWLEQLGARTTVVQLQQTDGKADHHWPFTSENNAVGIIDAQKVLAALARSGATDIALILEIIPAFEQDDDQALADIRQSAEYWRDALTPSGQPLAHNARDGLDRVARALATTPFPAVAGRIPAGVRRPVRARGHRAGQGTPPGIGRDECGPYAGETAIATEPLGSTRPGCHPSLGRLEGVPPISPAAGTRP